MRVGKIVKEEALKPSVIHVTSPLIKILDEGFFPNIQSDIILDTLGIPMVKATTLLRQEKTGESKAAGRDSDNEKFVISR